MSAEQYRHTQVGRLILALALGLALAMLVGLLLAGLPPLPIPVASAALLVLVAVLFGSLTVTVDSDRITCRFGPGPIRKRFELVEVVSAELVRNAWWWGWGIRLTPRGWLFNVSGLDAVELTMRNGRHYRIGTDDPRGLAKAIAATSPRAGAGRAGRGASAARGSRAS